MSEVATNMVEQRSRYWVLVNIIGIGIYFYFASRLWPLPEDAGTDPAGTPIIWGLTVFPIFVACLLINIIWFTGIVRGGSRGKGWRPIRAWLLVMGAWFLCYKIEVYSINHGSFLSRANVGSGSGSAHPEKK